jgi:hypothetical protein
MSLGHEPLKWGVLDSSVSVEISNGTIPKIAYPVSPVSRQKRPFQKERSFLLVRTNIHELEFSDFYKIRKGKNTSDHFPVQYILWKNILIYLECAT